VTVSWSKCDMSQQEAIMPLLFGKLLAVVVVTTVAASIAVALGTVMALIDEADQKTQRDSEAAA
jgi:ABC-type anion transport system duplicated permease subunit